MFVTFNRFYQQGKNSLKVGRKQWNKSLRKIIHDWLIACYYIFVLNNSSQDKQIVNNFWLSKELYISIGCHSLYDFDFLFTRMTFLTPSISLIYFYCFMSIAQIYYCLHEKRRTNHHLTFNKLCYVKGAYSCTLPADWDGDYHDSSDTTRDITFTRSSSNVVGWGLVVYSSAISYWTCVDEDTSNNLLLFQ